MLKQTGEVLPPAASFIDSLHLNRQQKSDDKLTEEQIKFKNVCEEIERLAQPSYSNLSDVFEEKTTENLKKHIMEGQHFEAFTTKHSSSIVTKTNLYEAVIKDWFKKKFAKRASARQLPRDGRDLMSDYYEFTGELAMSMRLKEIKVISEKDTDIWPQFFGSNNPLLVLVRDDCPIVRTNEGYKFLHDSLINFFTARKVMMDAGKREIDIPAIEKSLGRKF